MKPKARTTKLVLDGNELAEIPLAKLERAAEAGLRTLGLFRWGARLRTLPEVVCEIETLEELDVSWNQLAALPKSFTKLARLRRLDISGNVFAKRNVRPLTARLGSLVALRELVVRAGSEDHLTVPLAKALPTCQLSSVGIYGSYRWSKGVWVEVD